MVLTLVPLYSLQLGASVAMVGLLSASVSFFPLLFAVRTGSLVDRFGARKVLIVASLILAASPVFVILWPSIPALFALQIGIGIANLLAVVAGQAYTASLGSGLKRESNFGWYTTFVSAGQVIGPLVAGVVADQYGFLAGFLAAGLLTLFAIASSLWLRESESDRATVREAGRPHELQRALALLRLAGVQFAMIVTFIVAFAQGTFTAFFPVVLEGAGFTVTVIGGLLSLRAAISMVLRPMVPRITRMLGNKRSALKLMLLLIVATCVVTALNLSLLSAIGVVIVMGVWWGLSPPLSIVMMVDGAADNQRGFALGVRLTANRFAQFAGPLAMGVVADGLSLRAGFLAAGAFVAIFFAYLTARDRVSEAAVP